MLLYALILIALGGGVAGWMGYKSASSKRDITARMNARNQWLKSHALARETDKAKTRSDEDEEKETRA